MRRFHGVAGGVALALLAACAAQMDAKGRLASATLQTGMFRQEPCIWDEPDTRINPCYCEADITAARTGDPRIDGILAEAAVRQFCKGVPLAARADVYPDQRITDFSVTRDDARWLSVVYLHYAMSAGAAHGGTHQEVLLYDKRRQRWVAQSQIVPAAHRAALGETLLAKLHQLNATRYDGQLWLDELDAARLVTAEGCYGCVLYPDAEGWKAVYGQYAVGPYAIGMVEVALTEEDMGLSPDYQ